MLGVVVERLTAPASADRFLQTPSAEVGLAGSRRRAEAECGVLGALRGGTELGGETCSNPLIPLHIVKIPEARLRSERELEGRVRGLDQLSHALEGTPRIQIRVAPAGRNGRALRQ